MALGNYLPPIVAQIIMDTKGLAAGVGEAKAQMGALETGFTKLGSVGKYALLGIGVAAAAVGYESVKMAMNFDQQMELLHTQAGATQARVESLKTSVLALAPAVGVGPDELAAGLYHIASTGAAATTWMDTLTQSAKLAKIGMADLDTVTYALSGVMSANMKDVKNASDAVAFMNAAVGEGDMRMQQLATAIGTGVLPSFKNAGLGMNDFVAMLTTIADNSTPADEAATRLRMSVGLMAAPTQKAAEALNSIGMSSVELGNDMRQPNGGLVAIMDLKKHLDATYPAAKAVKLSLDEIKTQLANYSSALTQAGVSSDQQVPLLAAFKDQLEKNGSAAVLQSQVLEHAFGGAKTSSTILTMLDELDKLKGKYAQQGTSAERAAKMQEAWASQQKQFKQQLNELVAQLQVWGVQIGNWLIPKIQDLVKWIASVVTWLQKHKDVAQALGVVIASVLLVAIAAYTVSMISAAAATIAATWPVLAIIAVVAALGVGIWWLATHWNTAWNWIKQIAGDVWHWIYQYIWHDGLLKFYDDLKSQLDAFMKFWEDDWNFVGKVLQNIWDHTLGPIINGIRDAINGVSSAMHVLSGGGTGASPGAVRGASMNSDLLPHHDKGGFVAGPLGSPQLIVAHGGEYVLTTDQVRGIGSGGSAGVGGTGDINLHATFVMPDGRQIRTETLRYARRAGLNASDLYADSSVTGSLTRS